MARLVTDTFVKDPATRRMVHLRAGEEPAPEYAALVTNPDAWEDGQLPTTKASPDRTGSEDDKPAAKKAAARKPARGRSAADEGDSGD